MNFYTRDEHLDHPQALLLLRFINFGLPFGSRTQRQVISLWLGQIPAAQIHRNSLNAYNCT